MRRGGLWSDARQDIENLPGIGKKLARKIIEELGDGDPQIALGIIGRNPYSLCEVDGIAFKRADRVAGEEFAIGADDPRRHEAGNRFILEQKGVLTQREFIAERIKLELRDPTHIRSGIELENDLYWLPEELDAEKGLEGWLRGLPTPGEACPLAELTPAQQAVCQRLTLDEQQTRAVQAILANPVTTLTGGAGCGKCLGRGTPVLMFDGTIKPVEDVQVDDLLMGPDSTPRRVLSLARGREMMYRVTPVKGMAYEVNESHILSLRMNDRGAGYQKGDIVNISIPEYLSTSERFRAAAKGWRTGVEFAAQVVPLDPYILGIWLGDGHADAPHITTQDGEVQQALMDYASQNGLTVRHVADAGYANTWGVTTGQRGAAEGCNPLVSALKTLEVWKNKHVPQIYLSNNREIRLQLLAGLLDSDGHLSAGGGFDFISKEQQISESVAFLARSLGLAAYVKQCQKSCQNFTGTYWRVSLSGHLDIIPNRVAHKKAKPRQQIKDVLNVGINVEAIGDGDYYGFTIDGDHLFLLGDFTVTHNTHIVAAAAQCLAVEGKSVRGMAFAGKAADRMREAFDRYGILADASTIHKALGFQKKAFTVEWLSEDLIVIDESSMLPNWLAWAVIKRLAPSTRLVLVGDPNQLPPIGYGTPFVDIIKHGVARVHLLKNYRQQDQQGILHVAEGILHRKRPQPAECVEFHLGVAEANLVPLFRSLVEKHGGQEFDAWQCITYQNENAERYNLAAQDVINPHGAPLFEYPLWRLGTEPGSKRPKYRAEVREGDKIIVVKNSTLLGIFNGQTGRVLGQVYKAKEVQRRDPVNGDWEVARGEHMMHLRVKIGNQAEPVEIPGDELEKYIQLGYVITVHKAQGSDWDRVIVMQPGPVRNDTARRFFYTATTRSKNHLVIVSMATVVAWWTNAAADAPEVDSSLTVRLSRPAPEPVGVGFCEFDALATGDDYEAEPGPEYDAAIEAVGAARPLLYSEWQDVKAAHAQSPIVTADDPHPAVWRGLRQHPQQPESVATAVALDVGLDVAELERIQVLWDDMEVA